MKLLIAIPALNEEESIEEIIRRTLDARQTIIDSSPVTSVDITVVSDGSTDDTVDIARRFEDQISLIVFERNRGYGAAIQAAWEASNAELLGFLDADGTCDPLFFATLCRALEEDEADISLGNRMNPLSRMPRLRRLGNRLFALMLTLLSSRAVRDTASGMRVIRRDSLHRIMPLPSGLHFTPAMSARALLSGRLRITERDMPYEERQGSSKLSVIRDGIRFLQVIVRTSLLHRPSRPLVFLGLGALTVALSLMTEPTLFYFENRSVEAWMIYRFVVSNLAGTAGCLLICAAYLSKRIVSITLGETDARETFLMRFFSSRAFLAIPGACLLAGSWLVWPSFVELLATGATYEHWSRFIAMSFLWSNAFIMMTTRILDYCFGLVVARLGYLEEVALSPRR